MLAIIQARMSSKRFKGKVLKKLYNKTVLEKVYHNVKKCKKINKIVIATSIHSSDDKIVKLCKREKINFFRGDLKNVTKRFFKLLGKQKSKYFVRICADSPLLDTQILDKIVNFSKKNDYDVITNVYPRSFPKGQSIEILNKNIFIKNFPLIKNKYDQEHVTT